MKVLLSFFFTAFLFCTAADAQSLDSLLPVRGFCIAAPKPAQLERFIGFIKTELAPRNLNTLVLRVDWNYQYKTHPELSDKDALSENDVAKLVKAAKESGIRVIPQVNLLGHQSWASTIHNLLREYPQFDETPAVKMPEKYAWPNADSLYCKSYCPLHPDLHQIVFAIMDEICDAFESDAFHAGMDEVFYIGDKNCPRCSGRNKALLFAGEVNKIQEHLSLKNRSLWIWGDRLIDGRTTGIGMWEGSFNNTYPAIDLISKKVVINDWHYERPDPTAALFALKGFQVITCPWRNAPNAVQQTRDMIQFRKSATDSTRKNYLGMMQTVWSGAEQFLNEFYSNPDNPQAPGLTASNCFRTMYDEINGKNKIAQK
ncbi:family 20 glycosylhydrolase [Pollutibacter soli]|uniref:family 20 glycosylhydrolase n=1 Tax=Pollutibacter soli TaxID=3034157 RepID=UPI00301361D0